MFKPLEEYRISDRHARFKMTLSALIALGAGLFNLLLAALLYSRNQPAAWGHGWGGAVGVSTALALWGAYTLCADQETATRWGQFLQRHTNRWYPHFYIVMQHVTIGLIVLSIWAVISRDFDTLKPVHHVLLLTLLVLMPIFRITAHYAGPGARRRAELLHDFVRLLTTNCVAVLAALLLTMLIIPPNKPFTMGEIPPPIFFVWIPVVLVAIATGVLFIDRLIRG